jgi:hypothetical protein
MKLETIVLTAGVGLVFLGTGSVIGCLAGFAIGYCIGSQRSLCVHADMYVPYDGGDDDGGGHDFMPQAPTDPEMARWGTNQN